MKKTFLMLLVCACAVAISANVFAADGLVVVKATEPSRLTIPANSKMTLLSVDAHRWSHDPMASMQFFMMLPGLALTFNVDEKTPADIHSLIGGGKILVRKNMLDEAWRKIENQIKIALHEGGKITITNAGGPAGWVESEIWKKYFKLRNPDAEIDTSYEGACGEETDYAPAYTGREEFLGRYPGVGLPIGALIAKMGRDKPVPFCRHGDVLMNKSGREQTVVFEINDNQPFDNSGECELRYLLERIKVTH